MLIQLHQRSRLGPGSIPGDFYRRRFRCKTLTPGATSTTTRQYFRLAFRPCFLEVRCFPLIAMPGGPCSGYPDSLATLWGPIWWHNGHEMLFGFGSAIVVGFC